MLNDDFQSTWFQQFKDGDSHAAQQLWDAYFTKLCQVARERLGVRRGEMDEEDVALSALKSFYVRVRDGRYNRIDDPTNLWPLLAAIVRNKAVDQIRRMNRVKRGGTGKAAGDDLETEYACCVSPEELFSNSPTPEFTAELSEQLEQLLRELAGKGDSNLQEIVLMRLEGNSNAEIARRFQVTVRTVERKLKTIAEIWERKLR